ncbi:MAG: acyl-CoA dehydrogenase family protein [Burkholderiaceae bacterium]
MDLRPTTEQQMLRDSASRWVADRVRAQAGGEPRPVAQTWREMAGFGWLAMTIPERDGGLGQGLADACVLAECLGAGPVTTPYLPAVILAGGLLADCGSEAQRARWLAPLAAGDALPVIAHVERDAGHALDRVAVRATRDGGGWRLDGEKSVVPFGDVADAWIVSARTDAGEVGFFVVERGAAGARARAFETVDGGGACRLALAGGRVDDAARLPGATLADLERVTDRALVVACAESVGAMAALLATTVEYTRTRVQFGRPLAANQVLRHRMADLSIALDESRSVALGAVVAVDDALRRGDAAARARAAAGARAKVGACARRVTEEAVQLHGGMGVTQELAVGSFMRRQLALDAQFGPAEWHLRRHAGMAPLEGVIPLAPDESAFRDEVRAFLREHLTPELARSTRIGTSVFSEPDVGLRWQRTLHARGWVAPAWPAEYGGTGWTLMQRWIFETEFARAGAPSLSPLGLKMAGPVIQKFGTPEQKAHYLPRMLAGDDYWCQGYSEPGSGSDLASLKTRAVRDGDHYVVDGTKIWTTHAHYANRMFALVRTGQDDARKQDGISFLLIDMKSPGITVRPIRGIGGDHEVNQVFFDGVRVPVSCRVGEEGQGWQIAKYLLEFERGGSIMAGRLRARLEQLRTLAASVRRGDARALDDADLALAFSAVEVDTDALEMTELRVMSTLQTGQNPGSISSLLKLRWSEIHQAMTRLAVRVIGPDALAWEPARPLYAHDEQAVLEELARPAVPEYLNGRAFTIFGGSSEIQREIIARETVG